MNQEERNKRKQKWMAHGYGMAKILREAGEAITDILNDVRDNNGSEFDAFTAVLEQMETNLHECNVASFTEKFLIFIMAEAELKGGID